MLTDKSDILSRLRKVILPLEGLTTMPHSPEIDLGLSFMKENFPQGFFPQGAIHEFISTGPESAMASTGFVSALVSGLMKSGAACVWIGSAQNIFPPALTMFGMEPDRILFVILQKEKDILWATEEALKCETLAAVVCEMPELSFMVSRRFQLAVEKSHVTGFILRNQPRSLLPNACVSRWNILPQPTFATDHLPGLGYPRWQVDLQKIRNGKPGSWLIEWAADRLQLVAESVPSLRMNSKRKTG